LALAALGLLALAAAQLNALAVRLLPLAVLALVIYPYTKRFTWLCHVFLGLSVGAAAAGGWIATSGAFALSTWLLWAAVALWISGFDVLYALLDLDFDRRQGLYSLPACFGIPAALWAARSAHTSTVLLLVVTGLASGRGGVYYLGLAALALVLVWEHMAARPDNPQAVNRAFFLANVIFSLGMLGAVVGDLVL